MLSHDVWLLFFGAVGVAADASPDLLVDLLIFGGVGVTVASVPAGFSNAGLVVVVNSLPSLAFSSIERRHLMTQSLVGAW